MRIQPRAQDLPSWLRRWWGSCAGESKMIRLTSWNSQTWIWTWVRRLLSGRTGREATFKVGLTRFAVSLWEREVGRLLVDYSLWSHKRVENSQTFNSGFPEKVFEASALCVKQWKLRRTKVLKVKIYCMLSFYQKKVNPFWSGEKLQKV